MPTEKQGHKEFHNNLETILLKPDKLSYFLFFFLCLPLFVKENDPIGLCLHLMNCLLTLMFPAWKNIAKNKIEFFLKEGWAW